jgi:pyruvate,water dikinase
MVDSAKAGVMFTANPVTSDKNQLVIEGSYGLGESVVSGKVTPDTYIVQKTPIQIKEISIGSKATSIIRGSDGKNKEIEVKAADQEKQLLDGKEIKALAELGIKIELHYNKPQDIEWAIDSKGKVHILQSRPITTL